MFYRKDVLVKYYGDPTKYSVEDGSIFCASRWSLRIDDNHLGYVVVFLGDLGHLTSSRLDEYQFRTRKMAAENL